MNDLEKRIQTLEDIESIKKLKMLYCYYSDAALSQNQGQYDELVSLFTDDARIEFIGFGVWNGKDEVKKFFTETVFPLWSYHSHMVMNPIIEVNVNRANGNWYCLALSTTRNGNRAVWVHGKYEEEYVKVAGQWMWKSITFIPDFYSPYEDGWAKTAFITL